MFTDVVPVEGGATGEGMCMQVVGAEVLSLVHLPSREVGDGFV